MKLKFISMAVFSALTLGVATSASAAPATVNGGTVQFKGEVVNAACAVNANSFDQTVQLGQVRTEKLKADGDKSAAVGFNIELSDCDTTVATKNNVLALQGSASGTATNVGVQVLDHTGSAVTFDGNTPTASYTLSDGTNKIPFQALYIATGQSTAGTANADATFKVQYQ